MFFLDFLVFFWKSKNAEMIAKYVDLPRLRENTAARIETAMREVFIVSRQQRARDFTRRLLTPEGLRYVLSQRPFAHEVYIRGEYILEQFPNSAIDIQERKGAERRRLRVILERQEGWSWRATDAYLLETGSLAKEIAAMKLPEPAPSEAKEKTVEPASTAAGEHWPPLADFMGPLPAQNPAEIAAWRRSFALQAKLRGTWRLLGYAETGQNCSAPLPHWTGIQQRWDFNGEGGVAYIVGCNRYKPFSECQSNVNVQLPYSYKLKEDAIVFKQFGNFATMLDTLPSFIQGFEANSSLAYQIRKITDGRLLMSNPKTGCFALVKE